MGKSAKNDPWLVPQSEPFSFGNCLLFDGVNDYVANTSNLVGIKTFNCWFYTTAVRSWLPFNGDTVTNKNGITWRNNGVLYVIANSAYDTTLNIGNTPINQWVMLTVVYRLTGGSSMVIDVYINGAFVRSSVPTTVYTITANRLGNESVLSAATYFNAKMDEVAYWSTNLTATQISNLYNGGAGDYATNYNASSLMQYLRMDESSGTNAPDTSGNGVNGTLTNFTGTYWVAH